MRRTAQKTYALSHPANDLVRVIDRVKHSVVSIRSYRTSEQRIGNPEHIGAGFVIRSQGYILTNQHVIHDTPTIKVNFINGKEVSASPVWMDKERDLCLLKVAGICTAKPLPLGSSQRTKLGEIVISIGNPLGLGHAITTGIISGKKRTIEDGEHIYRDLIQTDCAINPGNSGGPLINLNGEVIAINSFIARDYQRIGFAMGIDGIKKAISKFRFASK
ncbi:S1C family serine protease [Ammoniphilus sp. CFH 90114]|uniref:S1C family serine protease n=1 Tax=Ammoniphilus sp. CFH 90114 TaxID=2493665 RepID=UPI001F0BB185|nr:trypsin-like peptidase domain-containing protein [Ammoniphilus sp. CFH 90114]